MLKTAWKEMLGSPGGLRNMWVWDEKNQAKS